MDINLPDFKDILCYAIVACGKVEKLSENALAIIESNRTYSTNYQVARKKFYALAIFSESEDGCHHFHLEAASRKPSNYGEVDAEHIPISDFRSKISNMLKSDVEVQITGYFSIEPKKIHKDSLTRPLFFEVKENKYSIRTMRMDFVFDGTPWPRLSWRATQSGKSINVGLSGQFNGIIDPSYLTDFLQSLDRSFRALVLGESPNE
jgi:hypothetical protein